MNSTRTFAQPVDGPVVTAKELVVEYGGNGKGHLGLQGLTASFPPGITGLIGPNGAGKTTFFRAAAGLLPLKGGTLEIGGKTPRSFLDDGGVGFLPENPILPPYLSVEEFFLGLAPDDDSAPRRDGVESPWLAGLSGLLDKRLHTLSLGQRKKVALSAALLGGPTLLLLDEPTNGLDPLAVRELRESLRGEGSRGTTVIISSHHLDELQRLADGLVFVRDGAAAGAWSREEALGSFGTLECLFDQAFSEAQGHQSNSGFAGGGLG